MTLRCEDRERAQVLGRRTHARDAEVDLSAEDAWQYLTVASERDMRHFNSGLLSKAFTREVRQATDARCAVSQLFGVGAGHFHKLGQRLEFGLRRHSDV